LRKPRPLLAKADPARRRSIKKTPKTDEGRYRRSLGSGRSALSTARIAVSYGGFLQRPETLWFIITPHARASDTSLLCACETASSCFVARAEDSRRELLGIPQGVSSGPQPRSPAARGGGHQRQCPISPLKLHLEWRVQQVPISAWTSLPPYSPPLNPIERGLETHTADSASTTATLPSSIASSLPSKLNSRNGLNPMTALRRLCAIT